MFLTGQTASPENKSGVQLDSPHAIFGSFWLLPLPSSVFKRHRENPALLAAEVGQDTVQPCADQKI
ncbi:MAG: hypothetical protein NWR52_00600, partial [Paracoccaceae bacterium]|nr:hypothetical protein [Paracoccaceae bacterium]